MSSIPCDVTMPPFIQSDDWMRLPLTQHPDFTTWQPFLDELITHPAPDAFDPES